MENMTTTIDAMRDARVRPACPQAGPSLLPATREWTRGWTVSASVVVDARALHVPAVPAPLAGTFRIDGTGFGAPTHKTMDVVYLPTGEPPV